MNGATIQTESKDKRKARKVSLIVNGIIVALLLFPFLTYSLKKDINYESAIVLDFSKDFKSSSAKSSTKKSKVVSKQKTKTEKVTPKRPKVKVVPVPSAPHKPVIESHTTDLPPVKTAPVKSPEVVDVPEPDVIPEDPTPVTEPVFDADDVLADAEVSDSSDADSASGGGSDTDGEGDSGSSTSGDSDTDGVGDSGNGGMDFEGNGILTRRIIKRGNAKKLAKEEGVIIVNVCVNKKGRMIYARYNPEESTIDNIELIADAQNTALDYRFEKDYSAPPKQCGKMTFIFEIED